MFRPIDIPARAARRPCSKEGALRGKSELNERLKLAGASGVSFVSEKGVPQSQITHQHQPCPWEAANATFALRPHTTRLRSSTWRGE